MSESAAQPQESEPTITLPRRLVDDLTAIAGGYTLRFGVYIDPKKVRDEAWGYLHPSPDAAGQGA